jgi:hypothetical protein
MATIEVTRIQPLQGSMWAGEGIDPSTGALVRFWGDWRAMAAILAALESGEEPVAEVPEWALNGGQ